MADGDASDVYLCFESAHAVKRDILHVKRDLVYVCCEEAQASLRPPHAGEHQLEDEAVGGVSFSLSLARAVSLPLSPDGSLAALCVSLLLTSDHLRLRFRCKVRCLDLPWGAPAWVWLSRTPLWGR